jgi:predicted dehydrogenase
VGVPPERRFTDAVAMIEAVVPDIAVIATRGVTHAETGIALATTGRVRAILCEKPFTSTAAQAIALVSARRGAGILIAEALKFRHHPAHLALKARVAAGVVGDIRMIRSTFWQSIVPAQRQPEANWRWNRARGGGSIYDLACYGIHHARFVAATDPFRVHAAARHAGEVDAAASITFEFADDVLATISVAHDAWHVHDLKVAGTAGSLRRENAWNSEDQGVTVVKRVRGAESRSTFAPTFQFSGQLRHLASCLQEGISHRIPPEDSIAQMRVIDAIFASMASGLPAMVDTKLVPTL